jgi:hypothetical protein
MEFFFDFEYCFLFYFLLLFVLLRKTEKWWLDPHNMFWIVRFFHDWPGTQRYLAIEYSRCAAVGVKFRFLSNTSKYNVHC